MAKASPAYEVSAAFAPKGQVSERYITAIRGPDFGTLTPDVAGALVKADSKRFYLAQVGDRARVYLEPFETGEVGSDGKPTLYLRSVDESGRPTDDLKAITVSPED